MPSPQLLFALYHCIFDTYKNNLHGLRVDLCSPVGLNVHYIDVGQAVSELINYCQCNRKIGQLLWLVLKSHPDRAKYEELRAIRDISNQIAISVTPDLQILVKRQLGSSSSVTFLDEISGDSTVSYDHSLLNNLNRSKSHVVILGSPGKGDPNLQDDIWQKCTYFRDLPTYYLLYNEDKQVWLSKIIALKLPLEDAHFCEDPLDLLADLQDLLQTLVAQDYYGYLDPIGKKIQQNDYDVYLSYNDDDYQDVRNISELLKKNGLLPWFVDRDMDLDDLPAALDRNQIRNIKKAVVFIGKSGRGPWENPKEDAILKAFRGKDRSMILVYTSNCPKSLPSSNRFRIFNETIDFRYFASYVAMENLSAAIRKSQEKSAIVRNPQSSKDEVSRILASDKVEKEMKTPLSNRVPTPPAHSTAPDFGFVIALQEEFRSLFPQITSKAEYDRENGQYYYLFSRPKPDTASEPHHCVVTVIGDVGPENAALSGERLINRYNPAVLVNIGIAGSLDDDVLIGDIVVADQCEAYLHNARAVGGGGGEGFDFLLSGNPFKGENEYINHAKNLEFAYPEEYKLLMSTCQKHLESLFQPQILSDLEKNGSIQKIPKIHTGHVASGPIVGAAESFVKWLKGRSDRKYVALEMESAGVMNAAYARRTKTLVIRGISDFSDHRKTDFDKTGKGALRSYAMRNALSLMWTFLDLELLK